MFMESEAGESSETGNTGAYPPNYTVPHTVSQVTVIRTSNNDLA